ncbi:MAG: hypothetical protein H7A24_09845 [Leptospiraceae bacterium]|nr:hypothetical protein [Leptospiraceae bacterium]
MLCYNNAAIHNYSTTNGSGLRTFVKTVNLSKARANTITSSYSGRFACDRM